MSAARPADPQSIRQFFDLWSIYDRVLAHDYMYHNALYRTIGQVLAAHAAGRPLAVLDLGCGSGRHLAPALAAVPVRTYEGHDLSPVAIDHARATFAAAPYPVRLCVGDLRTALAATHEPPVDVVFSGFTLHHFTAAERAELLRQCRARLAPGGLVLWVDAMRTATESREEWLDAYCGVIEREWTQIPPAERAAIYAHIRASDQPGTLAEHSAAATAAGFTTSQEHLRLGWHVVWSCR